MPFGPDDVPLEHGIIAVSWFVAFTDALRRRPEHRDRLRAGDTDYAIAFAHEVRRFYYSFAPIVDGRAITDPTWQGQHLPAGSLVLLDTYGENRDPRTGIGRLR